MKKIFIILLLCSIISPSPVFAGRSCQEREITPAEMQKANIAAVNLYNYLENTDADLALVGRVGSDLSKYDLKYSHVGIAMRHHQKGRWFFIHELNKCATSTSKIYDEGVVNFYMDDPYEYDSIVMIPSDKTQRAMLRFLKTDGAKKIHNPNYSMISNPFSAQYQNSNEFVLAILVASHGKIKNADPKKVASYLKENGYKPETIRIGFFNRLGAAIFKANAAFDDQKAHKIDFVSVKSVKDYLLKIDAKAKVYEIKFSDIY